MSLGALSCTGNRYHRAAAGQLLGGVTRLPYDGYLGSSVDTADYIDHLLSDRSSGVDAPAAVIVETVQGEGGLNVAGTDWLRKVAAIARRHGALLIVDDRRWPDRCVLQFRSSGAPSRHRHNGQIDIGLWPAYGPRPN